MNNFSELKRNTIIIGISTITSKAIAFILAPLYSYFLSTSQYGTMDLITTTVSLLMPVVCLDIYEATFRYSSDKEYDSDEVLSTSLFVSIPGILVVSAVSIVALLVADSPSVIVFTCLYLAIDSINQILSQYLRGMNRLKEFAISGVVNSVFLLAFNLLFLICIRLELFGWMISFLLGKVAMLLYCLREISRDHGQHISRAKVNRSLIKTFLAYCIPLLPTAIMWWIMNASDRYMLAFFLGTGVTGIYAVANKLPSILSILENIFYQSFQISGINNADNDDRNVFYTKVFNSYISVLGIGIAGLLIILKPATLLLFESSYSSAWYSAAILVVAIAFHALTGNLGSYYVIFKKTRGALITSAIGAVSNIVLNAIFIPSYGMMAAALTTLASYVITLIVRWVDTSSFVHISLDVSNTLLCLVAVAAQLVFYYVPGIFSYLIRIVIFFVLVYRHKDLVKKIIKR